MKSASGIETPMVKVPHALSWSALTTARPEPGEGDDDDEEDGDGGRRRRRPGHLLAGDVGERAAATAGRGPENDEVVDRARQADAGDEPDQPGSVAELRGQDRTDEGTGPCDGREVMAEEDEPVCRVIVVAVVPNVVRRRHAAVVERHDPRRDERAVIAVRDHQDAEDRKNEVQGPHRGESSKTAGTSVAALASMAPMKSLSLYSLALDAALAFPSTSLAQHRAAISAATKCSTRNFDFQVLKTDHFDIYYYQEEEQAARMAARMAERWYARLSHSSQPRPQRPAAVDPVCERSALPPDQRDRRRDRRGHRRRDRGIQAADRPAVCRSDRSPPITCSATSWSTPFSTTSPAPTSAPAHAGALALAALVHRGHGRISLGRTRRPAYGDVDAGSGPARKAAGHRRSR